MFDDWKQRLCHCLMGFSMYIDGLYKTTGLYKTDGLYKIKGGR